MLHRLGIASRLELAVFVSIVLLVAISPLGREATHPVVIGLTRTLLLTFVVAAVLHANQSPLKICPYFLGLAGLLVAWMALSVLMIPGGHSESAYTFYEDFFFLAAFVLSAHLSRTRSIAWKNALLTTVVVVDVAYLAGAIAIGNKPLTGTFVNPNYFASFLLAGLAVCTACVFFGNSSRIRMWAAAACALFYYGIGQTASRGATLAAMILVALAVFRAARKRRMSLIPVALAFAALGAVTVALNPNLVAKFLDRGQHDPYNYQRVQIWKGTLQMIREHPITGVGLAHFRYRSKQYTPALEGGIGRYGRWPNIAHSEYLQYASEIGIPAAALMFSLIGYLMVLAWRRANTVKDESRMFQEAALLTAAGIGAQALVDNNWSFPVIAAALAVISQADLLPYRDWDWSWTWTPVRRAAFALGVLMVFFHSTVITALGFYFNVAGQSAYKAEDFQRAQTLHRLALAILPRHSVIIDNLGLAYLDDFMKSHRPENLDRAESLFKQALAANPDFDTAGGHLERALIQRLTGDAKRDQPIHVKIIEIDRRNLQSNPFNPFIRKNLAEALYNSGNRQEAREQLLKAVELEPNYVPAYLRLSEWSREDGRAQEGDEYRKKAIQVVVHYQEQETLDPFETLLLGRPGINLSPAMKNKTIVCALAFAALFFAVLMPPEAYPNGKLAVLLCATFPFFISITERRIPAKYLLGGLCLFGLLLIHALWISVDLYSSLDFTTVIWTYYCLIGFFLYAGFEPLEPLALTMVALAVIVSGYSFYQYFWGFDRLYTFIFYAGADQVVKTPALRRIADRRVFSTLALPGTLWGFLAIALPFHAALWRKNWLVNSGLAISAVALLGAGFLTRSFGFVLGLLVLACAWILLHHRRVIWNRLSILFLVLAVIAGSFYSVRRGVIETSNPAGLRLKNWVSAWTIFATHPLGTGGNTFGVMYPRYMLPGANETQYTHNTPLQLLSEFGVPLLLTGIALFLLAVKRWKPRTLDRMTQCCLLALIAWGVHNLVDIDVYFPSLGVIGAVLIGVFVRQLRVIDSASQDLPAGPPRAWMSAPVVALGIMAMLFSGLAMVSSELKHRAQAEYEQHKMDTAVQTLEWAKTIMPIDSSLYHDAGDILLDMYTRSRDPKHLVAATESFRQAIALSPMKVGPHIGLGLCLSWTNDLDGALEQVRAAEELFPDSTYVQSIAKLLEGRKGN